MNIPWDDGVVTEEEFTVILKTPELKQMFRALSEKEQHEILKKSAPKKSKMAKTLDKLAKYLKLYQLLDYHNWAIKLVRVNRDGTAQAYDLFDCYAASLEREADLLDLIPLEKPWRIET